MKIINIPHANSQMPDTDNAGNTLITQLTIKGFKGFESFEMNPLSRLTLLGGRNNVGKTSVLEALFMLHDRLNSQVILRQLSWRGVSAIGFDPQSMWAPIFTGYQLGQQIEIAIVVKGKKETMRVVYNPRHEVLALASQNHSQGGMPAQIRTDQKPVSFYSLDTTYENSEGQQTSHLLMGPNSLELHSEHIPLHGRKATFISARAPGNPTEDAHRFGQLDIIGRQESIVSFLKIIEPRLKSLSSVSMGDMSLIHGDIGLSRKIPVAYMGDGISRLLSIILAIATTTNGMVLIDEFENGIHYSVMSKIWKAIGLAAREYNCQMICTTHSYECLEAAQQGLVGELADDFSYIRIDRDDNTCTAKCFDHNTLAIALKNNMEVR